MQTNLNQAKKLLTSYFQFIFEQIGIKFDANHKSEINEIVNNIYIAVIKAVNQNEPDPFPAGFRMDNLPI